MTDTVKIRTRNATKYPLPQRLEVNEIAYDGEDALYIGTKSGNKMIGETILQKITALEKTKLTANKASEEETLPTGASLEDVISAYNSLISSLRSSGIME